MTTFETKVTETMEGFDSGSRRGDRTGKGRFDLLPYFGIKRLADLYERGARAYGDRNWAKGQPLSRYIDSMLRHGFMASAGYTDEDHIAAVAWNALAIIDHQERIARGELPAELDDLPRPAFDTPDQKADVPTDEADGQFHVHFPKVSFDFQINEDMPNHLMALMGGGKISTISTGERPYHAADLVGHNHD